MATSIETMWVSDQDNLQRTVQTLVSQGGVVQGQSDTEVTVFLKKKMNVIVLIVGLVLCLLPGLAYLIWYSTADQNQQITVKIGSPANIKTEHQHWYDGEDPAGATTVPTGSAPPAAPAAPSTPALPVNDVPPPGYELNTPAPAPPPAQGVPAPPPPSYQPPPAPPAPPGSPIV